MGIPGEFGSTLIGGLISAMLYGITTLQTYLYYMHYSEDGSTMKFIVATIWVLDTLHVSFMCHALYYYFIINWGVPTSLEYIVWSFLASTLMNTFVFAIVQCFFAHTIYCLCRRRLRWLVTAPILLLVLARFGLGMVTGVATLVNNGATSFASHFRVYTAIPAECAVAAAEVLITVSLCVLFYESRSRSAIPRTKRLLNTLLIYAVNRCFLTLLVVIAEATATIAKLSAWSRALSFVVGKLYANSLLASLNTRQHLRSQDYGPESDLCMTTGVITNPLKLSGDKGSSRDGVEQLDGCEADVVDITTKLAFDKTKALRRAAEV